MHTKCIARLGIWTYIGAEGCCERCTLAQAHAILVMAMRLLHASVPLHGKRILKLVNREENFHPGLPLVKVNQH